MPTIKIISDPYHKDISFFRRDEASESWIEINSVINKNSDLIKEKYKKGFFPFIAEELVKLICKEYHEKDKVLELVFEGSEDEYNDLKMICTSDRYSNDISLKKSDRYLENARKILPEIVKEFQEIKPLIEDTIPDSEKINEELRKITDAASNTIPICVLGNYSSGKSTFINALVGKDILPSADSPLTARVYKISNSRKKDFAEIAFQYKGEPVDIIFGNERIAFLKGKPELDIVRELQQKFHDEKDSKMETLIHNALKFINGYDNEIARRLQVENEYEYDIVKPEKAVSDLVEIRFPFIGDVWNQSDYNFVIFDTPGSNSDSNFDHVEVLRNALKNMSNGLPIYVSDFDSLDSIDNNKLITEIKNFEELDFRFSMIVVNKADMARLPKEGFTESDVERIKNYTVPRNLYSDGIYYVSSVMGLGAKNDGSYLNEHYAEMYEDLSKKYGNPSSKYYKTLYKYNITAEQLKQKMVESAEACQNLILANSGIQSVENEIETFASKYAHYNKCLQSLLFLKRVIVDTKAEMAAEKAEREKSREVKVSQLDLEAKILVGDIREKGDVIETGLINDYRAHMEAFKESIDPKEYSQEELLEYQNGLVKKMEAEMDYQEKVADVQGSVQTFTKNLFSNVQNAFKSIDAESFKKITEGAATDLKGLQSSSSDRRKVKAEIDKSVAETMINKMKEDYKKQVAGISLKIDVESEKYWVEKTDQVKNALLTTVTGSENLSQAIKDELSQIILTYENIDFEEHAEEVFTKENFEYKFIFGFFGFGLSDRLNLDKLANKYNQEVYEALDNIYTSLVENHKDTFVEWMNDFISIIVDDIIDLNPSFSNQAQTIKREKDRIEVLKNAQIELNEHAEIIKKMMEWKEA